MEFFKMGGFPMFIILLFGAIAVVNAARFAWAPSPGRVPYLVALGVLLVIAGVGGTATDFMAVATQVPSRPEWANDPQVGLIVLAGFGESMAPTIFASGMVMAETLLVALGLRRLQTA